MDSVAHLAFDTRVLIDQASQAGVKEENEDSIGIRVPEGELLTAKGVVAVIADGVSASEAGKEASECCVNNFLSDYYSTPDSWTVKTSGQKVLTALNRWLFGQSQRFLENRRGYISTMSTLIVKSRTGHIFHAGDSRIYRYRGDVLELLTHDHAIQVNPATRYLSRAMGLEINLDIDYRSFDVREGDVFVLSTDGIHDFLTTNDIKQSAADFFTGASDVADDLIQQALKVGSTDNLSCQFLKFESLASENQEDAYSKLAELPFPPDLSHGMVIDGYKVLDTIHASARSQLYVVKDSKDPDAPNLVMKTPSVNFDDDLAYIERFVMEPWVGKRVVSDHVVKIVEPERPRHFLYYLCEHVDGQTLGGWIKDNPQPDVRIVVEILEQIIKGVRAFHRKETLHQDLKPDNIVITQEGVVKIIDFGSCYVAGINEIESPIERDVVLGTADYSAPEYRIGKKANTQSDQFSLAIIAYEMLTGTHPFGEKYQTCQQYRDFSNLNYIPSFGLNPLVPIWVDGALKKALSVSQELRYGDVSEFLFDLSHPNKDFLKGIPMPLLERNPIRFWQGVSAVFAAALLASWLYFLNGT
ncbi:MAG: serine/threonine protein kinase [Gammaproteobacteria bacterium]|nr:MAG: serine/threonine protein kinase [Gammaproteobacteria bacterium]